MATSSDQGLAGVWTLYQAKAQTDQKDPQGRTALHIAVWSGSLHIVDLLLHCSDVNGADLYGRTPLFLSSFLGHLPMTRLLVEAGANKQKTDPTGRSPLHTATVGGHFAVVRFLIEAGANRNQVDRYGSTPLMEAARLGHVELVRLFLQAGVDVLKADRFGRTPLDAARAAGHLRVTRCLMDHAPQALPALPAPGKHRRPAKSAWV
ncbi:unnamed protein product [Cladocopium goreaui]|uniref:Ankyrin repeat domain-containing protein 50 n=1 Tax=Cladocopium goreaui TaxID=2562237 RepID=A0A9P1GDZ5_9DINO|nr:unnamed protein product [Cladocopium goreaui]